MLLHPSQLTFAFITATLAYHIYIYILRIHLPNDAVHHTHNHTHPASSTTTTNSKDGRQAQEERRSGHLEAMILRIILLPSYMHIIVYSNIEQSSRDCWRVFLFFLEEQSGSERTT